MEKKTQIDAFGNLIIECPNCEEETLYNYTSYYACAKCGARYDKEVKDLEERQEIGVSG